MALNRKLFLIFIRGVRSRANPGIQKRLQIFKEEAPDLKTLNIDEDLNDLEMDIMSSKNYTNTLRRDVMRIQKKIEFKQIERKYFGSRKLPNMLLWAEKEKIRLLHHSDPTGWTYEKLSERFPAIPQAIRKIIDSDWRNVDADRIKKHDLAVIKNWKALENGELDLPTELKEHISKFTSRATAIPLEEETLPSVPMASPTGEFGSIIRSEQPTQPIEPINATIKEETYLISRRDARLKSSYTLKQFKQMNKEEFPDKVDETATKAIHSFETHLIKVDEKVEDTQEVEYSTRDFPLKINIPPSKKKKGALYKFNNCYYTDDGQFLYKV